MSPASWPPVLELVFDKEKVAVGLLMLFLWAVSKATECVWKQMRLDPTLGGRLSGKQLQNAKGFAGSKQIVAYAYQRRTAGSRMSQVTSGNPVDDSHSIGRA